MQIYTVEYQRPKKTLALTDLPNGVLGQIAKGQGVWAGCYAEQARIILLARRLKLLPNIEDPKSVDSEVPLWRDVKGRWWVILYVVFLYSLPITYSLLHG